MTTQAHKILTLAQRANQSLTAKQRYGELVKTASKITRSLDTIWANTPTFTPSTMVPLANLRINPTAQRDPWSSGRVKKMNSAIKSFDCRQFDRVKVARRPDLGTDVFTIVDGQGSCLIAMAMGLREVPFEEVIIDSPAEEARIFIEQNKLTDTINRWEKHSPMLSDPTQRSHTQAIDIQKVLDGVDGAEYSPQMLPTARIDVSRCWASIKDMIVTENKETALPAGSRSVATSIELLELSYKIFSTKGETLTMRSDILYPMMEFVQSYKKGGVKRLEKKLTDWKVGRIKNGYGVTQEDFAFQIDLPRQKNTSDKKGCSKNIRTL